MERTDGSHVRLEEQALRQLLARQFPLDRVGPVLRASARKALMTSEIDRMRRAARSIAAELLRRGELVRVAVVGKSRLGTATFLVRGTTDIVDLAVLNPGTVPLPEMNEDTASPTPPPERSPAGDVDQVLVAMEEAQNLRVGEPQSGQRRVILLSILNLLRHFVPGLNLFVWLFEPDDCTPEDHGLCGPVGDGLLPAWLNVRRRGQTAIIDSWQDLPETVREQLVAGGNGPSGTTEENFCGAVAVPLLAPALSDSTEVQEDGLLIVIPGLNHESGVLLRLARRLSLFVTNRWHRHSEVNLRIHTDSLTGVNNRAFFDSHLTLELERARRRKSALTLVLADLDHFKNVNDTYGHQTGDRVLQAVAHELLEGLRRIDQVCRIGGEEFALILPDTDLADARDIITRLMVRIDRLRVGSDTSKPVGVTLSFGGVTFPAGGSDAVELYRKADLMLYRSKETGRHRCHFWNQEGQPLVVLPGAQAT